MIDGIQFRKRPEPCNMGHTEHAKVVVPVLLRGKHSHDFAGFPPSRELAMDFEVYDESKYRDTVGYCQGRSAVGCAIVAQGIWESFETRLAVEILATGSGAVLDFGCNQGWYTTIAAKYGHDVYGFDSEPETLGICARNIERNNAKATLVEAWIDSDTPAFTPDADVLLLKADVEGAEFEVVKCTWPLWETRRIQYGLLEISPCFREGYDGLIERIMALGYSCYVIPGKMAKYREAFSSAPLDYLEPTELKHWEIGRWIKRIRQENVILVRTDA